MIPIMDRVEYSYTGNRLESVTDQGDLTDRFTYSGSPDDYVYDHNGNLPVDDYKGMSRYR